ncbi:MAG: hypothetical protein DRP42_03955 [Tenericutes bacterium]|nr:MAG: hypothetical protein DRP42_03955 [Mycoplasmatota bacterium]
MAKQKLNFKKIDKISNTDILNDKSPKIRELSINVTFPLKKEDKKLMLQMIEVVRISQDDPVTAESRNIQYSNGISAIQLGHNKKMIYVRIPGEFGADIEEFALVNPRIE